MSSTFTGQVVTQSILTVSQALPLNTTASVTPQESFIVTYNSTDVNCGYFNTYNVTTTPTNIDLTTLTDAYGNAMVFGKVLHLIVSNNDTTNNLTVGGGTNPIFATALPVLKGQVAPAGGGSPGSSICLTTLITVDATHKVLQLTASAGTVQVDVVILGHT